jgi:hypothetical protein
VLEPADPQCGNARVSPEVCWICGATADSSEHVFKARDLRRIFDKDGYESKDLPLHFSSRGSRKIRGPDSELVQYPRMLCRPCNNDRTSQHDRAYDQLSDWFVTEQSNYNISGLDFAAIFGADHAVVIDNLYRYCVKSLGCRVIASGCELSDDFPNPLSGTNMERLALSICRLERFRSLSSYSSELGEHLLSKGDLLANISKSYLEATGRRKLKNAVWWEGVGHFQISYWFNISVNARLGHSIDRNARSYPIVPSNLDDHELRETMGQWIADNPLL